MKLYLFKLKIFIFRFLGYEKPLRVAILKILSLIFKTFRPHYETIVYESCLEAKKLGINEVSILELGVASGSGIISLEKYCNSISRRLNIKIKIFGFDIGTGLPKTDTPHKDLGFYWKEGQFKSEEFKTEKSKIYYGDLKYTLDQFIKENPYPISAIFFDLDLYSSTKSFLDQIKKIKKILLPRILCYFDDIYNVNNYISDINGELLAIKEFNQFNSEFKFGYAYDSLMNYKFPLAKNNLFTLHYFSHPKYLDFVGYENENISPKSRYVRSFLD
jgi:hypothetical protein